MSKADVAPWCYKWDWMDLCMMPFQYKTRNQVRVTTLSGCSDASWDVEN